MAFDGSINAIIGADISQYADAMNKVVNVTNSGMAAAAAAAQNHSNSKSRANHEQIECEYAHELSGHCSSYDRSF